MDWPSLFCLGQQLASNLSVFITTGALSFYFLSCLTEDWEQQEAE